MGGEPASGCLPTKRIAVLGGGLAGLSAARRLLDLGFRVSLVEKRPFLGGRAYSFRDSAQGVEVDNGQHVFLGCCSYYIDFLEAIGASHKASLQKALKVEVVLDGKSGVLSGTPALGPLHLLPSFVRYPHLGLWDKLLVAYGMLRLKLTDRSKRSAALDSETGYEWLKRHHQTERAISNLWNLITLPSLNDDVRDVSADMTLMVFQESLLNRPRDAAIGYSKVGLSSLNGEPAQRYLEARGCELTLGKAVKAIRVDRGQVVAVEVSSGETIEADAYVSALPFQVLHESLQGDATGDPFFSGAASLSSSPIVGIHLWYDRPIMDQDFIAFLDSPVQWVFNKSLIQGESSPGGQYVCISLSGAWDYIDVPKEALTERFTSEMARLFPKAKGARVKRSLVVKERHATFRSSPGAAKHRRPQVTPIENLFLAGEWTDTGWPSTMEGAVRSGVFAADAVTARVGSARVSR